MEKAFDVYEGWLDNQLANDAELRIDIRLGVFEETLLAELERVMLARGITIEGLAKDLEDPSLSNVFSRDDVPLRDMIRLADALGMEGVPTLIKY